MSENQWAYRQGHSTELLFVHMNEIWRKALDSGSVMAAAIFVDSTMQYIILYFERIKTLLTPPRSFQTNGHHYTNHNKNLQNNHIKYFD